MRNIKGEVCISYIACILTWIPLPNDEKELRKWKRCKECKAPYSPIAMEAINTMKAVNCFNPLRKHPLKFEPMNYEPIIIYPYSIPILSPIPTKLDTPKNSKKSRIKSMRVVYSPPKQTQDLKENNEKKTKIKNIRIIYDKDD